MRTYQQLGWVIGLSAALLVSLGPGKARAAGKDLPPAERARRIQLALDTARAEGLTPENSWLQGRLIRGEKAKSSLVPFPGEGFPYRWDFDDGTLCGINEVGSGIKQLRVEGQALKFGTEKEAAYFSWGNFDKTQSPLHFSFDNSAWLSRLATFRVRIRQSLPESKWTVSVKNILWGGGVRASSPLILKGSGWQTVEFPIFFTGYPPYGGVRIATETGENQIEIDWIQPLIECGRSCYRRAVVLPADVRWARCSIVAGPTFTLHINGKQAAVSAPLTYDKQLWNFELDPALFHAGTNILAFENGLYGPFAGSDGSFLLDGAALCASGDYVRFDSDTNWIYRQDLEGLDWILPNYDTAGWGRTVLKKYQPEEIPPSNQKFWFNPSYKGQVMVSPADGRDEPVFGSKDELRLAVAVPKSAAGKPAVGWRILDEMGDGFHAFDKPVRQGVLALAEKGADWTGELKLNAGELPVNTAYAVVFTLTRNGREIEKRRYEVAVCGPVHQPVVDNPTNYTDGMELKLVWAIDAAAEQNTNGFLSCDGEGTPRPSAVIETPLGKFRQPYAERNLGFSGCNYVSWKYRLDHPGRPHVAIADYPDDTVRMQDMRVAEWAPWRLPAPSEDWPLANHSVVCGLENPLTHQLRQHHAVFWPSQKEGTITIVSVGGANGGWHPARAARVGQIGIYEILNDIPMTRIADAPGPEKWIGQQPEAGPRLVMHACFASPAASMFRYWLILSDAPNFYRNWMLTYINQVKRLRFAGENAYYYGEFMYDHVLYPSRYSYDTEFGFGYSGSLRPSGRLMARLFEENGMAFFSELEMCAINSIRMQYTDEAVAAGQATLGQVNKYGKQSSFAGRGNLIPNWIHPDVRAHFETVINELIALYGKEKGWKGICLQVNELLGPCWLTEDGDPYACSYDDYTTSVFENETGIKVPVAGTDPKRFQKRYAWLLSEHKKEWTDWRCRKMTDIYAWVGKRLQETRPDLKLVLFPQSGLNYPQPDEKAAAALPVFDYARRQGLDVEYFKRDPATIFAPYFSGTEDAAGWLVSGRPGNKMRSLCHNDELLGAMANDGKNGVTVRYNWLEPDLAAPQDWPHADVECWPYPSAGYFADYWMNIFIRSNPTLMINSLQDISMWMGRETDMAKFAKAYRSLPAVKYQRLRGSGRDRNVWIQTGVFSNEVYGYIANAQWWDTDVEVTLAPGSHGQDLLTGKDLPSGKWKFHLAPYTMQTFKIRDSVAPEAIAACNTEIAQAGRDAVARLVAEAETRLKDNRDVLQQVGRAAMVEGIVNQTRQALAAGDYAAPYEVLTAYPYTSLWIRQVAHTKESAGAVRKLAARKRTLAPVAPDDEVGWKDAPLAALDNEQQVFPATPDFKDRWDGPTDISASLQVQWDPDNLYVRVAVVDDKLYFDPDVPQDGDSVELYVDAELGKDKGESVYSDDDTQIKLAPPAGGEGPLRIYRRKGLAGAQPADAIAGSWRKTADGYVVSARIPWSLLRIEPVQDGLEMGFDVMLNDAEKKRFVKQWMVWSANTTTVFRDPTAFGRLVLGDAKGEGPGKILVKSPHLAFQRARTLAEEKKYADAWTSLREALTNDVWDKADPAECNELRQAYILAAHLAAENKDLPGYFQLSGGFLDDPDLPMDLKAWLAVQRASMRLIKADVFKGEREARWLIETSASEISDAYRAYGYMALYDQEMGRPKPDQARVFELLANQQTCNNASVNYLYAYMADALSALGNDAEALGLYVRAWSLWGEDRQDLLDSISEKIQACLKKLNQPAAAEAWQAWLLQAPADRGRCPVLGLGRIPETWEKRWSQRLDLIKADDARGMLQKGRALMGLGRFKQALPLLERAARLAEEDWVSAQARDWISLTNRWGKNIPESLP